MTNGILAKDNSEKYNVYIDLESLDEIARFRSVLFGVPDLNVQKKENRDFLILECVNNYKSYLTEIKLEFETAWYNQESTEVNIEY